MRFIPPDAPTVLVVDDERLFIRVTKSYLGRRFHVVALPSAAEAIAFVRGGARPDLVLCDVVMPDRNGGDFYRALLADAPEIAGRVTFMTGGTADELLTEYIAGTGRPCLRKPIEPEALVRYIEDAIARAPRRA